MVRGNQSLKQAAVELDLKLDPDEVERIARRQDFQEIFRVEQNKHFAAVANDPSRSKSVAIGKLEVLIDHLMKAGEYDKAGVLIEKLGKLEGWSGADSNINVFSGLTARDIAEARERLTGSDSKRGIGGTNLATPGESGPTGHA